MIGLKCIACLHPGICTLDYCKEDLFNRKPKSPNPRKVIARASNSVFYIDGRGNIWESDGIESKLVSKKAVPSGIRKPTSPRRGGIAREGVSRET